MGSEIDSWNAQGVDPLKPDNHKHQTTCYCLICQSSVNNNGNSDINFQCKTSYLGNNYLFLAKVVLELPENEQVQLGVQKESLSRFQACESCRNAIEIAKNRYSEIMKTTRRFRSVQKGIMETLKKNYTEDKKKNKRFRHNDIRDVKWLWTQFNNSYTFNDFGYPFHVQDVESMLSADLMEFPIKYEIPDDDEMSDKEGLYSVHDGDSGDNDSSSSDDASHPSTVQNSLKDLLEVDGDHVKRALESDNCGANVSGNEDIYIMNTVNKVSQKDEEDNSSISSHELQDDKARTKSNKSSFSARKTIRVKKTRNQRKSRKKETQETDYKCPVCHTCLKNIFTLRGHIKRNHPNSTIPPNIIHCHSKVRKSEFAKLYPDINSQIKRNSKGRFPCPIPDCTHTCSRKLGLERHIRSIHFNETLFTCTWPDCSKTFTARAAWLVHIDKHKATPKYKCVDCDMSFYARNPFIRHMESEHQEGKTKRPFICETCGQGFTCRDYLSTHKSQKHKTTPYMQSTPMKKCDEKMDCEEQNEGIICDLCGKVLKNKMILNAHKKRIHDKIAGKHGCHLCNKKFLGPFHLKQHLVSHGLQIDNFKINTIPRSEKSQCPVVGCRLLFIKPEELIKHMKKKHGADGKKEGEFKCTFCGKHFHLKFKWKIHVESHENQETRPYKCSHCDKGFTTDGNLKFHQRYTHKLKLEDRRLVATKSKNILGEDGELGQLAYCVVVKSNDN